MTELRAPSLGPEQHAEEAAWGPRLPRLGWRLDTERQGSK